jgi:hypothetical protein
VLRNAVLGPDAFAGVALRAGSEARTAAEGRAKEAAAKVAALESPIRLSVDPLSIDTARGVLAKYGASYTLRQSAGKGMFLIANPMGLSGEEHPYAANLGADLFAAGVRVLAYRVP